MSILAEIAWVFLLGLSIPWEVYNDRRGDRNKKLDVLWRGLIIAVVSAANWWITGKPFLSSFLLGGALHFFIFDYWVSYEMWKNEIGGKDWFSYLGKSSEMDKFKLWRSLTPAWRFTIRLIVLAGALIIYF